MDEALIQAASREHSRSYWVVVSGPRSEYDTDFYGLSVAHPPRGRFASSHRKRDFRPGTAFKGYVLVPGRVVASRPTWKGETLAIINAHIVSLSKTFWRSGNLRCASLREPRKIHARLALPHWRSQPAHGWTNRFWLSD